MNVIEVLRGRKAARIDGIEELALRLASGETVAPDEVEVVCERCGATLEQLEEAVAVHERRIELKATAAGGPKAEAALKAIEKKRQPLVEALEVAEAKLRAFDSGVAPMVAVHEGALALARHADDQLLAEKNLRPVALRALQAAKIAAADASRAATAASRAVGEAAVALREAEDVLKHNTATADRGIPEHVQTLDYNAKAVETRSKRLADAKAASAEATRLAERAREELRAAEDAARRS